MNSNLGKTIFYFLTIAVVIFLLFYFFKTLSSEELGEIVVEEQKAEQKTNIQNEIDLELLRSSKFINLKKNDTEESVFKAGRRNPFEPYE